MTGQAGMTGSASGTGAQRLLRRSGPVIAVFGLVVAVMTIAIMSGPRVTRIPVPRGTPVDAPAPQPPPPVPSSSMSATPFGAPGASEAPGWLRIAVLVLGVLVVAAVVVGIAYLLRRLLRHRAPAVRPGRAPEVAVEAEVDSAPDEIRAAVAAGIVQLDDDAADARQAVIGCWLRLEAAAAAAGTARRPEDTAADLAARMLAEHHVSSEALRALADLYRRARYAPGPVDDAMRSEARATLTQLGGELGRPRAGADA